MLTRRVGGGPVLSRFPCPFGRERYRSLGSEMHPHAPLRLVTHFCPISHALESCVQTFRGSIDRKERFLDDVTSEDELRGEDVAEEIEGVVRDD
jgi:hypothetical protein